MIFTKLFFTTLCLILTTSQALPIELDTTISINNVLITDRLSEYYENIVDQVMLDVSEDVLRYIPNSISHGLVEARQLAQKSMDRNLNFMRASLLASITSLVSNDILQINGFEYIKNNLFKPEFDQDQRDAILLDSILTLNKKISRQLGLIINAEKSSNILMKQANNYFINQQESQLELDEKTTTITFEWSIRQPFKINIIREEQQKQIEMFDISIESEWLYNRLLDIESNLLEESNDRIEQAIHMVNDVFPL